MNQYLLTLVFSLWASFALAFPPGFIEILGGGGTSGPTGEITPLWSENWSGTDELWTVALGAPNTNHTATISGLTEDLLIAARTDVEDKQLYRDFTITTAGAIYNARFKLKCTGLPTATGSRSLGTFSTADSARSSFYIGYSSGARLQVTAFGGALRTTAEVVSPNTEYWVHLRGQKGAGTDAKASVAFGTTWPLPITTASGFYIESVNGTTTVDPNRYKIGGDNYSSAGSSYDCEIGTVEYWETTTW